MTGLNDTDIRLNSEWQLTQATDGDAPLCSGLECLYQNIVLERSRSRETSSMTPSSAGACMTSSSPRTRS